MILESKKLPFIEGTLHTLGLLNQNPITEIMASPVVTFTEIDKVGHVYDILKHTTHNGFPIIDRFGKFRGLIHRKTLCVLLELKAFSSKASHNQTGGSNSPRREPIEDGGVQLSMPTLVFYETLEKKYPKYPDIDSIHVATEEMVCLSLFSSLCLITSCSLYSTTRISIWTCVHIWTLRTL
jgi:hypothetical protein